MAGKRILMPAKTVAEWGGLHEYVVHATRALVAAGNEVTVACTPGLVAARVIEVGGSVVEVDWSDWAPTVAALRGSSFDLVLSHGPGSRDLALAVNRFLQADLYIMFHGAYHDYVYTWSDQVTGFLTVSPSLTDFLVRIGKVEPWRIDLVPNGVDDSLFEGPLPTLDEKLADGVGHVVMASRIARDKAGQFPVAEQVLRACSLARPDVTWRLDVLGDGPLRPGFESDLRRFSRRHPNVEYEFHGWVSPDDVAERMRTAVAAVVTGRGAITALAAGTLCVAVGARGSVGLQHGHNLKAGLWSNFGDHSCPGFTPSDLDADLAAHLDPEAYAAAVDTGRRITARSRSAGVVDEALLSALQCG